MINVGDGCLTVTVLATQALGPEFRNCHPRKKLCTVALLVCSAALGDPWSSLSSQLNLLSERPSKRRRLPTLIANIYTQGTHRSPSGDHTDTRKYTVD